MENFPMKFNFNPSKENNNEKVKIMFPEICSAEIQKLNLIFH